MCAMTRLPQHREPDRTNENELREDDGHLPTVSQRFEDPLHGIALPPAKTLTERKHHAWVPALRADDMARSVRPQST